MTNQKIPKSRKLPNVLTKEQLIKIFKAIEEPQVMMAVIFGTFCGLRIGEVTRLMKKDFDFEKGHLKVVNGKLPGKTLAGHGKDRVVPIPTKIIPLINKWFGIQESEYLFESTSKANYPITIQQLYSKYKKSLKKAQLAFIEKENQAGNKIARYNFHTLRHTYATLLWERTGDIYAVKQALGHNNLDTTMIYTHISDKSLRKKVNSAFDNNLMDRYNQNFKLETDKINLPQEDPLALIKIRLAKGEINIEDFKRIKSELR